ncbi:ABC transporter permease [Actinomadura fibrosa]|uniref:ABC transporter permease n=1 Tax=Actinomadura fibrosa TaxID=111802 RepID=A0ABW2XYQ9_9ACTN|nr:ABC transporter permease [Actinomadura fibrosa]
MTRSLLTARRGLRGVLGAVVLLAAAEAAIRAGGADPTVLPPPTAVLRRAFGLAGNAEWLRSVAATLTVAAFGLLIAIAVAVPVGLLFGGLPGVETVTRPVLEFLRPLPSVAIAPLALLVLQDEQGMKLLVIGYAASWPVLVNTMYGLAEVDPQAKDTLRAYGFGTPAVLWRVSLPSAAPFIATGVRLAASVALIVAVSVELISGGSSGIGVFMIQVGSGYETDLAIGTALWAGALGLAVDALLGGAERRLFRWNVARLGAQR